MHHVLFGYTPPYFRHSLTWVPLSEQRVPPSPFENARAGRSLQHRIQYMYRLHNNQFSARIDIDCRAAHRSSTKVQRSTVYVARRRQEQYRTARGAQTALERSWLRNPCFAHAPDTPWSSIQGVLPCTLARTAGVRYCFSRW